MTCWIRSHPQARAESYYLLLAHDAAALRERNGVFNGINAEGYGLSGRLKALATLAVSRINGSRYCAATVAQELQDDGLAQALFAGLPQGLAFTEGCRQTCSDPHRRRADARSGEIHPQSVQPLFNSGLNQAQALEVILTAALYAWENRLRQTLGDAEPAQPAQ